MAKLGYPEATVHVREYCPSHKEDNPGQQPCEFAFVAFAECFPSEKHANCQEQSLQPVRQITHEAHH